MKVKQIWEYEICDILNDTGSIDANKLLEQGWEPFAATEGQNPTSGNSHIYLWLRQLFTIEEKKRRDNNGFSTN